MNHNPLPLVAILRGIKPEEVADVAEALLSAGVSYIEIPLNSPDPFDSIEKLVQVCGEDAICGAGTVLTTDQIERLAGLGAKLVVSPHMDEALIESALSRDLMVLPGVATVTEAFRAIRSGATSLKLFPAGDLGPGYLKSISEVMPATTEVFAVGGMGAENLEAFWHAGASGFGIGGSIYRPGTLPEQVHAKACEYVAQVRRLESESNECI